MTFMEELQRNFPEISIKYEQMAKYTSFRIGGPAVIAFPGTCEQLVALYRYCVAEQVQPLILGAGTNILAPDAGMSGIVICTKELKEIKQVEDCVLEAECGASMSRLASSARDLSLTGLEFAHGIPGTVGGGVYMNAGAYGGEMRQVVQKTWALLPDGSVAEFTAEEHSFSYRHSIFEEKNAVILKTRIKLQPGEKSEITARMQELLQKRRTSQPLDMPSAGSTFKRPVGGYAAALIDEAGLKGKGVGAAAVSQKHAGFVVNLGGATAADVTATMKMIQKRVYERSGIMLEPEVRIW